MARRGGHGRSNQPNLKAMAATAAAHCKISSNLCPRLYRVRTSPNLDELVQETGRTECDRSLPPGRNRDALRISWQNALSVYVRSQKNPPGTEREKQKIRVMVLVRVAFVPVECFHVDTGSCLLLLHRRTLHVCQYGQKAQPHWSSLRKLCCGQISHILWCI